MPIHLLAFKIRKYPPYYGYRPPTDHYYGMCGEYKSHKAKGTRPYPVKTQPRLAFLFREVVAEVTCTNCLMVADYLLEKGQISFKPTKTGQHVVWHKTTNRVKRLKESLDLIKSQFASQE
jgi:hypothetical protein